VTRTLLTLIENGEVYAPELTTIVGVLGVDATTRPPISLLAKVKGCGRIPWRSWR